INMAQHSFGSRSQPRYVHHGLSSTGKRDLQNVVSCPSQSYAQRRTQTNNNETSLRDAVVDQILFCQNSSKNAIQICENGEQSSITLKLDHSELIELDLTSSSYNYNTSRIKFSTDYACIITSARHPHAFTVNLIDELSAYDKFAAKINDYYNKSIDGLRLKVQKEDIRPNFCCVTYDKDKMDDVVWNRTQILEYDVETDSCNVYYVDLGSWDEYIPRERLRYITKCFQREPVRALTCRLARLQPLTKTNGIWTDQVTKTFTDVINNCPARIEIVDCSQNGAFYVNLFVFNSGQHVCVNDFLLHLKMAEAVEDSLSRELQDDGIDENGNAIHPLILEFFRAGETEKEKFKSKQLNDLAEADEKKKPQEQYVKITPVTPYDKLIFARYNTWVMLPWFSISALLKGLDEDTLKTFAIMNNFHPTRISPLTDPILCANLVKSMASIDQCPRSKHRTSEITLYSIDCVKRMLRYYNYSEAITFELLDQARMAEQTNDKQFWYSIDNKKSKRRKEKTLSAAEKNEIDILKTYKNDLEEQLQTLDENDTDIDPLRVDLNETIDKIHRITCYDGIISGATNQK
ncbi:unnamed protein product, partial [Didymodactylos carnosus]